MNKKHEIEIEVLSSIDDEIIDNQTEKRYRLLTGKPKKSRRTVIVTWTAAASVVLVCSILLGVLLPMFFGKTPLTPQQVPVYEGMTVSKTLPSAKLSVDLTRVPTLLSRKDNMGYPITLLKNEKPQEKPSDHLPPQNTENTSNLVSQNSTAYYAKQNEDIYITIHIDNPSEFEILSFTLNDLKYQSYMFEDGSDSENLILKVNVGQTEALAIDYTIDAIKYVDGTEIKDVRMDGNRTVRVNIYPENQPTVSVQNQAVGYSEIRFDVQVSDPLSLIKNSGGEVLVSIYDGEERIAQQTINLNGTSTVVFDHLTPGMEYRRQIKANYDAIDGNGYEAHVLEEQSFTLQECVAVTNIVTQSDSMLFDLAIAEESKVTVEKIELLNATNGVIKTDDGNTRSFAGLSPATYRLRVTYSYDFGDGNKVESTVLSAEIVVDGNLYIHDVVRNGTIQKKYSINNHVYNPSTGDYRTHPGVDIYPGTADTGVYALLGGVVTAIMPSDGVRITSLDGKWEIRYKSIEDISVSVGDTVVAGQRIGTVGNSWIETVEDPHLHLEILVNGSIVDPEEYLK